MTWRVCSSARCASTMHCRPSCSVQAVTSCVRCADLNCPCAPRAGDPWVSALTLRPFILFLRMSKIWCKVLKTKVKIGLMLCSCFGLQQVLIVTRKNDFCEKKKTETPPDLAHDAVESSSFAMPAHTEWRLPFSPRNTTFFSTDDILKASGFSFTVTLTCCSCVISKMSILNP